MSAKTIEVASIHIGPTNLAISNGEHRTVTFEDRDGTGFAMIDNDEAEVLLGAIGLPHYWKPGAAEVSLEDIIGADPEASAAAAKIIGKKR